ncbi:hypothetical protein MRB53_040129 [Persea americana]|nr:hypothetical protein MRB53_040129 [Persea americana]
MLLALVSDPHSRVKSYYRCGSIVTLLALYMTVADLCKTSTHIERARISRSSSPATEPPSMAMETQKVHVPPKKLNTDYPARPQASHPLTALTDPSHIARAFRYASLSDWTYGAFVATLAPTFMTVTERMPPSFSGRGRLPTLFFRLSVAMGAIAGTAIVYQRSCLRFYGWTENDREVEMDMREMVEKVKKGRAPVRTQRSKRLHAGCGGEKQPV